MADAFIDQLLKWGQKTEKNIEDFYPALVEEIGSRLIKESPIISGRLRAHWHVSTSESGESPSNRKDPSGASTLSKMVSDAKTLQPGVTFYIINNVESQPEDDGPAGIHYAGVVNNTPDIRYATDFAPMSFPSFMFFDRVVGGSMLSSYVENTIKRLAK